MSTFCITFHIFVLFVVGGDREFKLGSASPRMTNHPWKGRDQVTWTILILEGTSNTSETAKARVVKPILLRLRRYTNYMLTYSCTFVHR